MADYAICDTLGIRYCNNISLHWWWSFALKHLCFNKVEAVIYEFRNLIMTPTSSIHHTNEFHRDTAGIRYCYNISHIVENSTDGEALSRKAIAFVKNFKKWWLLIIKLETWWWIFTIQLPSFKRILSSYSWYQLLTIHITTSVMIKLYLERPLHK